MSRPEILCLNCERKLIAYKVNTVKPRQCPKCWSYDLINIETLNKCKEIVKKAQNGAVFPGLRGLMAIIGERGFTFKPLNTLKLLDRIQREIKLERKASDRDNHNL